MTSGELGKTLHNFFVQETLTIRADFFLLFGCNYKNTCLLAKRIHAFVKKNKKKQIHVQTHLGQQKSPNLL